MAKQPATISSLDEALLQKIMGKLSIRDHGRSACTSHAFCAAIAPLAPALCYYAASGDAGALLRLLLKDGSRAGLGARHPAVRRRRGGGCLRCRAGRPCPAAAAGRSTYTHALPADRKQPALRSTWPLAAVAPKWYPYF